MPDLAPFPPVGRGPALERRVRGVLRGLGVNGCLLAVAVSGGQDSLALLLALAALGGELGLGLHAVHVDHGLRQESGEDARFVQGVAGRLGVPATVVRVDVGGPRRRGLSPEEAAREARYDALARVAAGVGAAAIALGHTADDQAETLLLHIARGSGLAGLRGMGYRSLRQGAAGAPATLVRPLLGVRRSETMAYCLEQGFTPLLDRTNLDTATPRNLVRLRLIPALEQLNPRVVEALGRLARASASEMDLLREVVLGHWDAVARDGAGGPSLDRRALAVLPPALQRHLLRRGYAAARGQDRDLEEVHLEALARLVAGPAGASLSLPGGVRAEVQGDSLLLAPPGGEACPLPPLPGETPLPVPGDAVVGGWRVTATLGPPPGVQREGPYTATLSAEAVGPPLMVRGWRPGDRFQPLGMGGREKKLQDCFVDARIPRPWRRRVPLVESPAGIAWVVGWRIAHWARVTPETGTVLRVVFSPEAGQPHPWPLQGEAPGAAP